MTVAAFSYVAILGDFNSKFNLAWLLGLPIAVAIAANPRLVRRIVMTAILLGTSFIAFVAMIAATGA